MNDPLDSFLESLDSQKERLKDSFVYFSPQHVEDWLKTKTTQEIADVQKNAPGLITNLNLSLLKKHIQNYDSLPANGNDPLSFGTLLFVASYLGDIDTINKMRTDQRFNAINANGSFSFAHALLMATRENNLDVINILLQDHEKFNSINPNGDFSLYSILRIAIANEQIEVLNILKKHPRFNEIDKDDLINKAAANGFVKVIKTFKNWQVFKTYNPISLGDLLCFAAAHNQFEVIKELRNDKDFDERVNINGLFSLGSALRLAAINGFVDIIEELKLFKNFNEIFLKGDLFSETLENCLKSAIALGHKTCARKILSIISFKQAFQLSFKFFLQKLFYSCLDLLHRFFKNFHS